MIVVVQDVEDSGNKRGLVHRNVADRQGRLRLDGDGDGGEVALIRPVAGLVGEAIGAVEVHVRGVGEAAVRVEAQRAVRRPAHQRRRQRIAVKVSVVRQHAGRRRQREHVVLANAVGVVRGQHRERLVGELQELDIDKRVGALVAVRQVGVGDEDARGERVVGEVAEKDGGVDAGAAVEEVVAAEADEEVVAEAAEEDVVAAEADENVVAGVADEDVVARAADQHRLVGERDELDVDKRVGALVAVRRIGVDDEDAAQAEQEVGDVAEIDRGVEAGAAVEKVVAAEADEDVVAGAADEDVVAVGTDQNLV